MNTIRLNRIHKTMIKLVAGTVLSNRRIPKMEISTENEGSTIYMIKCIYVDEIGNVVLYCSFGILQETLCALQNGLFLGISDHALSIPDLPIITMGMEVDEIMGIIHIAKL